MSELLAYNSLYGSSLLELILRDNNARTYLEQKLDRTTSEDLVYIDFFSNF